MKTRTTLISIGLAILLIGCGSTDNKSKSETNKISVPTKIDMEMPKALKTDKSNKTERLQKDEVPIPIDVPIEREENKSQGYYQLKNDIEDAEMRQIDLKINLLLADKIMPKIQKECNDTPLEETCNIEANKLSFVLDENMKKDIVNITREEFSEDYANSKGATETEKTFTLGKVSFTQHKSSADYQYVLKMDMSSFDNAYSENSTSIQTIKWSKDENRVWSIRNYGSDDSSSNTSIRYLKKSNGETQMEIDDDYDSSVTTASASTGIASTSSSASVPVSNDIISLENDTPTIEHMRGEFHFKISNLNDYFKINSNSKDFQDDQEMGVMNSIGEISDKGGYLSFVGLFMGGEEYREKNEFNANGEVVFSGYCNRSESCDMNDESTWLTYNNKESYEGEAFTLDMDNNLVELTVTGGDLKDGQYLLLSPNTKIDNLSTEEVFDAMVGEVYVSRDSKFASINSKEYLDVLDELVMVYVDFAIDEEETLKEPTFEVLASDKRPILTQE